jgi:hypothetical protein
MILCDEDQSNRSLPNKGIEEPNKYDLAAMKSLFFIYFSCHCSHYMVIIIA